MTTDQVILINPHVQKNLYVLLAINILLLLIIYWLCQIDSVAFSWLSSPVFYGLYALVFACTFLSNLTNKGKKITFSVREQWVYSQTILGRKKLISFGDIGAIKPYETTYGATYFGLFDKANPFGRNPIRISPTYSPGAKDTRLYAEFERMVLPQLQSVVATGILDNKLIINPYSLVFYNRIQDTYRLKYTYPPARMNHVYVALLLAVFFVIFAIPSLRLHYINFGIGAGIGAGIMAFLLTETKSFQNGNFTSEYTNGLFRNVYSLAQFEACQVIHRKHNFIYVGTEINLIINNKPVFLCQLRKTELIEKLIDETTYIINQQAKQTTT